MSVKLLTEHHLEFQSLKKASQARLSLFMSKCHTVENHTSRLICNKYQHLTVMSFLQICTLLTQKALEDVKRCKDPAVVAAGMYNSAFGSL